jgi:Short C-terminal domain/Bacterial PH domain
MHSSSYFVPTPKGILVLTPKRVLFYYLHGKKSKNYGAEDYSLDEISSINFNRYALAGSIKIHSNNNVINVVDIPPSEDIEGFVKATNQHIEKYKKQSTPVSNNNSDVAGQISKLAELRDKGILTEEEFTMQKRKLLGL